MEERRERERGRERKREREREKRKGEKRRDTEREREREGGREKRERGSRTRVTTSQPPQPLPRALSTEPIDLVQKGYSDLKIPLWRSPPHLMGAAGAFCFVLSCSVLL